MYKVVADYSPRRRGNDLAPSTNSIEYHVETLPLAKRVAEEYVATSQMQESLVWQERGGGVWELQHGGLYGRVEDVTVHAEMPNIYTADDRTQHRNQMQSSQE